tara:strand:- start:1612 stop:2136 length:525 start_codon:yes stop_codon:yes gene_type:complete
MIIIFDYFRDKINEYKKRNRNRPSYYRYFLIWLSFFILITAIFYCLGLFDSDSDSQSVPVTNIKSGTSIMTPTMRLLPTTTSISLENPNLKIDSDNYMRNNGNAFSKNDGIYKVNPTFKVNKKININDIENNLPTKLPSNTNLAPQIPLYDEVLKTVSNIPPPLTFVDDYKFEL